MKKFARLISLVMAVTLMEQFFIQSFHRMSMFKKEQ